MPPSAAASRSNYSKIVAMITFLVIDLALNSILDYDLFNDQISVNNASHLLLGLLGFQTVVEISAFLILFVSMADSFLFRVGLLGLLMKKFRTVLIFHPIYIAITVASGALRVKHLSIVGNSLATLYRYKAYTRLSIIQKIVAIPYYLLNIRATIKLGHPVYYNRDAWVALIKQVKDNDETADKRGLGTR